VIAELLPVDDAREALLGEIRRTIAGDD